MATLIASWIPTALLVLPVNLLALYFLAHVPINRNGLKNKFVHQSSKYVMPKCLGYLKNISYHFKINENYDI